MSEHDDAIAEEGYAVVEAAIPPAEVEALRAEVDRLLDALAVPFGDNEFLGTRTRRCFNLLGKSAAFESLLLHGTVLPTV